MISREEIFKNVSLFRSAGDFKPMDYKRDIAPRRPEYGDMDAASAYMAEWISFYTQYTNIHDARPHIGGRNLAEDFAVFAQTNELQYQFQSWLNTGSDSSLGSEWSKFIGVKERTSPLTERYLDDTFTQEYADAKEKYRELTAFYPYEILGMSASDRGALLWVILRPDEFRQAYIRDLNALKLDIEKKKQDNDGALAFAEGVAAVEQTPDIVANSQKSFKAWAEMEDPGFEVPAGELEKLYTNICLGTDTKQKFVATLGERSKKLDADINTIAVMFREAEHIVNQIDTQKKTIPGIPTPGVTPAPDAKKRKGEISMSLEKKSDIDHLIHSFSAKIKDEPSPEEMAWIASQARASRIRIQESLEKGRAPENMDEEYAALLKSPTEKVELMKWLSRFIPESGAQGEVAGAASDIQRQLHITDLDNYGRLVPEKNRDAVISEAERLSPELAAYVSGFRQDLFSGMVLQTWRPDAIHDMCRELVKERALETAKSLLDYAQKSLADAPEGASSSVLRPLTQATEGIKGIYKDAVKAYHEFLNAVNSNDEKGILAAFNKIVDSEVKPFIDMVAQTHPKIYDSIQEKINAKNKPAKPEGLERYIEFANVRELVERTDISDEDKAAQVEKMFFDMMEEGVSVPVQKRLKSYLIANGFEEIVIKYEAMPELSLEKMYRTKPEELSKEEYELINTKKETEKSLGISPKVGFKSWSDARQFVEKLVDYIQKMDPYLFSQDAARMWKTLMDSLASVEFFSKIVEGAHNAVHELLKHVIEFADTLEGAHAKLVAHKIHKNADDLWEHMTTLKGVSWGTQSSIRMGKFCNAVFQMKPRLGRKFDKEDIELLENYMKGLQANFYGKEDVEALQKAYESVGKVLESKAASMKDDFMSRGKDKIQRAVLESYNVNFRDKMLTLYDLAAEKSDQYDALAKKEGKPQIRFREVVRIRPEEISVDENEFMSRDASGTIHTLDLGSSSIKADFEKALGNAKKTSSLYRNIGLTLFASPEVAEREIIEAPADSSQDSASMDSLRQQLESILAQMRPINLGQGLAQSMQNAYMDFADDFEREVQSLIKEIDAAVDVIGPSIASIDKKIDAMSASVPPQLDREESLAASMDKTAERGDPHAPTPNLGSFPARTLLDKQREYLDTPLVERGRIFRDTAKKVESTFNEWDGPIKDMFIVLRSLKKYLMKDFMSKEIEEQSRGLQQYRGMLRQILVAISDKVVALLNHEESRYVEQAKKVKWSLREHVVSEIKTPEQERAWVEFQQENDLIPLMLKAWEREAAIVDPDTEYGRKVRAAARLFRQHATTLAQVMGGEINFSFSLRGFGDQSLNIEQIVAMVDQFLVEAQNAIDKKILEPKEQEVIVRIMSGSKQLVQVVKAVVELAPDKATEFLKWANMVLGVFKTMHQERAIGDVNTMRAVFNQALNNISDPEARKKLKEQMDMTWTRRRTSLRMEIEARLARNAEDAASSDMSDEQVLADLTELDTTLGDMLVVLPALDRVADAVIPTYDAIESFMSNYAQEQKAEEPGLMDRIKQRIMPQEEGMQLAPQTAGLDNRMDKKAESINPSMIGSNGQYSHLDLSENTLAMVDVDGRKKIKINKDLKNLVTKRMNEFLKGAHANGSVVHVDMEDHVVSGTVVAYLSNGNYKVACYGVEYEVPENRLFKI